jgi:hypothetical protein
METPLAITAFTQDFLDRQGMHNGPRSSPVRAQRAVRHWPRLRYRRNDTWRDLPRLPPRLAKALVAIHLDGFYSPRPQERWR